MGIKNMITYTILKYNDLIEYNDEWSSNKDFDFERINKRFIGYSLGTRVGNWIGCFRRPTLDNKKYDNPKLKPNWK